MVQVREFPKSLVNPNAVQHLDPSRYQKFLNGYVVVLLKWSSRDMDSIEIELDMIY